MITAARRIAPASWSVSLDAAGRSGAHNMACDVTLLRQARDGAAFLRLYRWDPPCLSFGRHEPAARRYDRDRIVQLGLDTVRRPTGGRAVWHHAEVTYAVAGAAALFGSLREAYAAIHAMLADALRTLGVRTELAAGDRSPAAPGAGACFAAPVGGEVVVSGRKLVGSAQVREAGAFLQHGSILLTDGQDMVARVTRGRPPVTRSTGLCAALGRDVTFDEVATAIVDTAKRCWSGDWRGETRAPATSDVARFNDTTWTWRR